MLITQSCNNSSTNMGSIFRVIAFPLNTKHFWRFQDIKHFVSWWEEIHNPIQKKIIDYLTLSNRQTLCWPKTNIYPFKALSSSSPSRVPSPPHQSLTYQPSCSLPKLVTHLILSKFGSNLYSETNVMHFYSILLWVKGLYMFRSLLLILRRC
jgi:hypothetical protein